MSTVFWLHHIKFVLLSYPLSTILILADQSGLVNKFSFLVAVNFNFNYNYTLILTRREDKGRIISPFKPTGTRTFSRNGQPYEELSIEHGTGGPVITLSTASGTVRVED